MTAKRDGRSQQRKPKSDKRPKLEKETLKDLEDKHADDVRGGVTAAGANTRVNTKCNCT